MADRNILITIGYDGADYYGWQIQPDRRTVQGEIQKALRRVLGREIKISGTSRTDAGVHALGQRAGFTLEDGLPTERIATVLNNTLPGDIRILRAEEKPAGFHARYSAVGKKYIYRMKHELSPFDARYYCRVEKGLDMDAVRESASVIKGTHDFKCFEASGGNERQSTVRTISGLSMEETENGYELVVSGDGFLYNMVRIITGTLVDAGRGRTGPSRIKEMLMEKDRRLAGRTMPPQGLYLAEVYYLEED